MSDSSGGGFTSYQQYVDSANLERPAPAAEPSIGASEGAPAEVPAEDAAPAVAPEAINLDEWGERLVPIKVNGEERLVPLRDAVAGHMRQEDYTRKTQELAQERKAAEWARAVQQGLKEDPISTFQALAQVFGVTPPSAAPEQPEGGWKDPLEPELVQLKARLDEVEQREAQFALEQEMATLKSQYGDLVDEMQVLNHAAFNGFNSVTAAFKDLVFGDVYERQRQAMEEAAKAAEKLKITDQKKVASAAVSGGHTARGGNDAPTNVMEESLQDSWNAVKRNLGFA